MIFVIFVLLFEHLIYPQNNDLIINILVSTKDAGLLFIDSGAQCNLMDAKFCLHLKDQSLVMIKKAYYVKKYRWKTLIWSGLIKHEVNISTTITR